MKTATILITTVVLSLSSSLMRAETFVKAWVNSFSSASQSNDKARKVVTDASGNVIVAGYTDGGMNGQDIVVIKYSGAGLALWTNRYSGPTNSNEAPIAVAVSSSGNVIVAGASAGVSGYNDYVTLAYSSAGVGLWTNLYNGPLNFLDQATAVTVDGGGNVIVTGYSYGSRNAPDYATIKYSSTGVGLWTNRFASMASLFARSYAVAADVSGNVFVSGQAWNNSNSGYDYTTIKYSSAGATLWTRVYDGTFNGHDFVTAMTLDSSGNVIVTGRSLFTISYQYATIKYSNAGVALWTNRSFAGYEPLAIAAGPADNVFVTGYSGSDGFYDYATEAYSSGGAVLWTRYYNGPGNKNDIAYAVAVDGSSNVVVTGSSYANNSFDYTTIKYSGAGLALWTNRYDGPANGHDEARSVAIGSNNVIYVTGASDGNYDTNATAFDFVTVKYIEAILLHSPTFTNGGFHLSFASTPGAGFTMLATTNVSWPLSNWTELGSVMEISPGQFQFTDPQATNSPQRFYRVRAN